MTSFADLDHARFVELAAGALGLQLDEASLEAVLANMRVLAEHAGRVMAFPLPPETPLAVDFRP